MKKLTYIFLWGLILPFAVPVCAQEMPDLSTDSLTVDSLAADTLNPDPEWYVAPEIPLSLRAPKRANAASACDRVSAIQSYNIDNQLIEGTYYEYDNAGRVISTTVWTYNSDGSQVGISKNEYGFDSYDNQVSTVVYNWDNTMNIWHGVSRYEFVYDAEQRMLSNTEYAWINYEWKADTKYTWAYDAAGREIEYYEYTRNTSTNQLEYSKGRIQTWIDDTQKSLEIIYTAYSNGAWSAGTKKEWSFDAEGHQTLYAYYASISNGQWVGSEKETWTYTSNKLTLHEKFGWANNTWSRTLKEETEYEGDNIVRIENYIYANGLTTGTKKEEYVFTNGTKTQTLIYAWSNGAWVGSSNETWVYNSAGKLTLHEKSEWINNDWLLMVQEATTYTGTNVTKIENYERQAGEWKGVKKEEYTFANNKPTSTIIYAWENGVWVNDYQELWTYNGAGKTTKHEQFTWSNGDWLTTLQENTTYSGANITKIENYELIENVWTGTQKEEYAYTSGKKTQTIIYAWSNGAWIEESKEVWGFTSGKQTLHELYAWTGSWVMTLQENTEYSGNNTIRIENYALVENVWTGTQKELFTFTNNKQTRHEQFTWINGTWEMSSQENTTYDGNNIIRIENYSFAEGVQTGTKKEEYSYTNGVKTQTITYAWSNNDWILATKKDAGYREGDVQFSEANYTWDGSNWKGSGTFTRTTYEGQNIIEVLNHNWPSGATEWLYQTRTLNTYDSEGTNIMTHNASWDGEKWVMSSMTRTDIIKDEEGRILLNALWMCSADSIWKGVKKDTAAYSMTNKPLYVASYISWQNNDWIPSSKIEYTYDEADHQILYIQYEEKNGVWSYKAKSEQAYDENNNLILNQSFTWNKNAWAGNYKYEYSYDEAGHQTMYAQYNWSSNRWRGVTHNEKVYDEEGNVIVSISYNWRNNGWVGSTRSENVFDAQKRVVEYVLKIWQSSKWINYRRTTYVFDDNGNTISTHQYWWNNNQWELYELDEKEYDLSNNHLRRELFASWEDNILQAYTDKRYFYNCDLRFYNVSFIDDDGHGLAYQTNTEGETPVYNGSTPTKPSTDEFTYTFAGWNPTITAVTSDAIYTATYNVVTNGYTIIWLSDDDTEIDRTTVAYGVIPTHDDPVKANTAQYTYTFTGWDQTPVAVTGDATYRATYSVATNSYMITWLRDDNTLIDETSVEFGVMPEHVAPEKAETSEYTYSFAGWTPEVVAVNGPATYKATFTPHKKTYTITWKNDDDSVIGTTTVEAGEMPSHTDASKPNTAEYTYTFSGWTPALVAVTGDATYTATYTSTKNKYTITWLNEDGSEIGHETLEYGVIPSHADATKENTAEYTYTFIGWTPQIATVTGDATYTAQFNATKNSYTVTWKNEDGTEIYHETVEYGVTPTYTGTEPTKAADEQYTYAFNGWTPQIEMVTGDIAYQATFVPIKNNYTILFLNEDGTELQRTEENYGATPVYNGATPTKAATAEFTYTFSGWDKTIAAVTEDATYTATYSSTKNSYTVTWLNDDNTQIDQTTVEYGETPQHANPTKAATAEFNYTFAGWTPTITTVTGDVTYTATFTSTVRSYTITWKNEDGSMIDQVAVRYGTTPTHEDPTKESTAEYTYTFADWTPAITAVTGEATYTATFTATTNNYTVTWLNDDGTEISHETLAYGATPQHADAEKAATAEYTYTFTGWTPQIATVTGDATYQATFSETKNSYTVTWLNDEGTEISHETVEYGATPTHADAEKASTAEYTYTFIGWTPAIAAVTGDVTYTAQFNATTNNYLITWLNDDNSIIEQKEVAYGALPTHADATKQSTAEYTYTFAGWSPALTTVTGEATYTATYTATKNRYTITWLNEDNVQINQTTVEYGETPQHADPTKQNTAEYSYTFTGWTPQVTTVTGDATYQATFSETKNSYTVTWLNDNGTEISHETVEYGTTPTHADATKQNTAEYTYTFIGWTPQIAAVTGDVTYTAQFNATTNNYLITWLNDDNSIIEQKEVAYGAFPAHVDPTKAATDEYTYTFAGWSPALTTVTGEATYTATYTATKNSYTITWLNEDNVQINQTTVEYGATPQHADATKQSTAEYTYTFTGWTPQIATVTGDATYQATFSETKNSYTVTWLNDNGTEISHETVVYGTTPTHADATKQNTAEYTYTFIGWTPQIATVTGDATYTAQFNASKNRYTITWLNEDGSELSHETLEYGATPAHADIYKESTDEYTYTFNGWTPAITTVTGDASYRATFTAIPVNKTYTISFYYEDGTTLLEQVTVAAGEIPVCHYTPSMISDDPHYYYTFSGWSPEVVPANGNASYTATYELIPRQYMITFRNYDNRILQSVLVDYGTIPEYTGNEPVKPETDQYTFLFTGWTPELAPVSGEATYKAVFDKELKTYTVIFYDEDGITELDRVEVGYGQIPSTTVVPTKEGTEEYIYVFAGWSPALTKVTRDASYTATYQKKDPKEGLDDLRTSEPAIKIFKDNTFFILRGGRTYTLDGQLVE